MLSPNRRSSIWIFGILAGILLMAGCATKKYVREQVNTLAPSLQQANNAVKENAERIDAVDKRAQQGISAAQAADQKAAQAGQAAQAAQQAAQAADRKADTANQGVQQANNRITTLDSRISSINLDENYAVSGTQSVTFAFNSSALSNQAKSTLDEMAGQVSGQRTGYLLELQGFTDSVGSDNYNIGLSNRRAESVQRYLVSKNVPLYRISIVGLGKSDPVADNKTKAGRDKNRRVEVRVLKSASGRAAND